MDSTIRVQKLNTKRRRSASLSRTGKHRTSSHSSLSVSHINRSSLSHHGRSPSIEHFVAKDAQSHDVIHTNVGTSGETLNPLKEKLSIHSIHLHRTLSEPSTQNQGKEQKKSFNDSKPAKLINNKIEPVDFVKIVRHGKPIKKTSSDASRKNFSKRHSHKRGSSLSIKQRTSSPPTTLDSQYQHAPGTNSNEFNGNITSQQKLLIPSKKPIVEKHTPKFKEGKSRRCRRLFIYGLVVPLVVLLVISTVTALLVAFLQPKSGSTTITSTNETTTSSTTLPTPSTTIIPPTFSTTTTNTLFTTSVNTSVMPTSSITTTTKSTTTTSTTTGSTTTSTALATSTTTITTTESTTSSTSTTASTTSTTTTTDSTTSSTTSTESTTSTTTTTESTTSSTTSTASTTSTTTTTESTTSSTTSTASTTSTTTTTQSTTSSTTSTASTTSTTTSTASTTTTTAPPINPCLSRIYWDVTGVNYFGNGTAGSALNLLNLPGGISITPNGSLYISDGNNFRVLAYIPNTTHGTIVAGTGTVGNAPNQLGAGIRYNTFDTSGNLYVVDSGNDRVMRWAMGGSMGVLVAGNGTGGNSLNQLGFPYSVWVDSSLNVYVTEYDNHRVTRWAPGSSTGVVVAGVSGLSGITSNRLSAPTGLFYDEANQTLYVSNSGGSTATVVRWRIGDSNGTIIAGVPGSPGASANQLNLPTGITLDQWQNLYVNDRSNNRIQLFCNGNSTGITIAGNGAGGTTFSQSFDVKLDSELNLYVLDYLGNRVYKFFKL